MLVRALFLAITAVAGFGGSFQSHPQVHIRVVRLTTAETGLIRQAAMDLAHRQRSQEIQWLRQQRTVQNAALGADGRTVEVQFRSGLPAAILPAGPRAVQPPFPRVVLRHRPLSTVAQPGAASRKALVLEPFATELYLGPHAGDTVAAELQAAGFAVTQLYESDVTLAAMTSLSKYDVVYIQTHSGVNQFGEAVLVTGELAADQSASQVSPEYETMTTAIEGSNKLYVGILSKWITNHEDQFPSHALFFANSCGFLNSTQFWKALQAKGVGALVGWDEWSMSRDQQNAAGGFFADMVQGMSVASALNAVKASGYAESTAPGHPTAHLGYLGDGSLTLQELVSPSTPSPAVTSTPTATPSSPPRLSLHLKRSVTAGARQTITVTADPNALVHLDVRYPNGDHRTAERVAGGAGGITYSFTQESSEITHNRSEASVRITADNGALTVATRTYRILYGPVDVSVEPRHQTRGKTVAVWIHSWPWTGVSVDLSTAHGGLAHLHGQTEPDGWVRLPWVIPPAWRGTATIRAAVGRQRHFYHTQSTLRIR